MRDEREGEREEREMREREKMRGCKEWNGGRRECRR